MTTPAAQSAAMLTASLAHIRNAGVCETLSEVHPAALVRALAAEVVSLRAGERQAVAERVAVLTAHRACGNQEQDLQNGKLAGFCVVCQIPWPCEYAGKPTSPAASVRHGMEMAAEICDEQQHSVVLRKQEKAMAAYLGTTIRAAAANLPHSPGYVRVPVEKLEYICKLPDSYPVSAIIQMVRAMRRAAQDGGEG